jgi:HPt (histidine-containing phosphotransfer) domain-containing protein
MDMEPDEISEEIRAAGPAFLARQRSRLQALTSALAARASDYAAVRTYAHNLRGTGRGYGYPELSVLARDLEDAAKAEDSQGVRKHMSALEASLSGLG